MGSLPARGSCLLADTWGAAVVEFAFLCPLLILLLFGGIEIARYAYQKMLVENAVHAAAMDVWKACDPVHVPATSNCNVSGHDLMTAISTGLSSNPLLTSISLQGAPSEVFYCVDSATGALVDVTATKPSKCTSYGNSNAPGDYIIITASTKFGALFPAIGSGGIIPKTIQSTAYMRLI